VSRCECLSLLCRLWSFPPLRASCYVLTRAHCCVQAIAKEKEAQLLELREARKVHAHVRAHARMCIYVYTRACA